VDLPFGWRSFRATNPFLSLSFSIDWPVLIILDFMGWAGTARKGRKREPASHQNTVTVDR
jgi:hypothetical protein